MKVSFFGMKMGFLCSASTFAAGYFTSFCLVFIYLMLSLQLALPVMVVKGALVLSTPQMVDPSEVCLM